MARKLDGQSLSSTGRFEVGDKIRPRVANKYNPKVVGADSLLTEPQYWLAHVIIRSLRRTSDTDHGAAAGRFYPRGGESVMVETRGKYVSVDGVSHKVTYEANPSVSTLICEAIRKGVSFNPKPHGSQSQSAASQSQSATEATGQTEPEPMVEPESEPVAEPETEPETETEPESEPVPTNLVEELYARFDKVERYLTNGAAVSDEVGQRHLIDGIKLLSVGIPIDAIMYSFAIDWPREAREACEIVEYDFASFGTRIPGEHRALPYVLKVLEAEVPLWLGGPPGTGKTHMAIVSIPNQLGIPTEKVGFISLVEGASPSWMFGRNMPSGYVSMPFVDRTEHGGIMVLDEIDSADPNLTTGLNMAIANKVFTNPMTGDIVDVDDSFLAIASSNTWGNGSDRDYARNPMDRAVKDRFRMGRVLIERDKELERSIVTGIARDRGVIS